MSTGRTSTDDRGILSNSIPKWSPAGGRSDPFYDVKARPSCTRQSFEMKYNGRGTLNRIEKSGEIRSTSATQRLSYVWCWAKYMLQATKSKSALISLASREQKCRLRNRHNIGTWSGNWGVVVRKCSLVFVDVPYVDTRKKLRRRTPYAEDPGCESKSTHAASLCLFLIQASVYWANLWFVYFLLSFDFRGGGGYLGIAIVMSYSLWSALSLTPFSRAISLY